MKKSLFLPIVFFAALATLASCGSTCKETVLYPEVKALVDSVQKKYVPDRRDDVFDVAIIDSKGVPMLKGATTVEAAKNELLSLARNIHATLIDSIELLPEQALGNELYGIVNLSVANVRTQAKHSAEMATQTLLGTPIKVLQKDGWYRIQTPDGYIGWTEKISFEPMTKNEFNSWITSAKVIFLSHYGFSYEKSDENSRPVSDLVSGNMLKLEGDTGAYYLVSYPDGRKAYVLKSQSKLVASWLESVELTEESIVAHAQTLMGVPYLWGGTSSKGLDCSGYVKTIMFLHGVILRRDASQQVHTGTPVDISSDYSNLHVGDLMFFGKKAEGDKKEQIRHVGFYLGNGEFIHAAGRVKINSLDSTKVNYDEVNTKEFIRASRVIGAVDTKGIWSIQNNSFYQVQE